MALPEPKLPERQAPVAELPALAARPEQQSVRPAVLPPVQEKSELVVASRYEVLDEVAA
jgi:hypothetical protein